MVAGREAWSSWARQCGRSWLLTEHGSFPGWTGLLQGGGGTLGHAGAQPLKLAHWALSADWADWADDNYCWALQTFICKYKPLSHLAVSHQAQIKLYLTV